MSGVGSPTKASRRKRGHGSLPMRSTTDHAEESGQDLPSASGSKSIMPQTEAPSADTTIRQFFESLRPSTEPPDSPIRRPDPPTHAAELVEGEPKPLDDPTTAREEGVEAGEETADEDGTSEGATSVHNGGDSVERVSSSDLGDAAGDMVPLDDQLEMISLDSLADRTENTDQEYEELIQILKQEPRVHDFCLGGDGNEIVFMIVLQSGYKRNYSLVVEVNEEEMPDAETTFAWQILRDVDLWSWIRNVGVITPHGSPCFQPLGFNFPHMRDWLGEIEICPTIAPELSSPQPSPHTVEVSLPLPHDTEPRVLTSYPQAFDLVPVSPPLAYHEPTFDSASSHAEEETHADGEPDAEAPASSALVEKAIGKRARQEASTESERAERPPPRHIRGPITPPIVPEYDIDRLEILGRGQYSLVTKGYFKRRDIHVALKEITLGFKQGNALEMVMREISLLANLRHPNIVGLVDVVRGKADLTLILEYAPLDLEAYMSRRHNMLEPCSIRTFAMFMLRGLEFCHRRRVIHRDIKPSNLLVTADGILKLADFGLARALGKDDAVYSPVIQTANYRAPEVVMLFRGYTTAVDMWSAGCVVGEMWTGQKMFGSDETEDPPAVLLDQIARAVGSPTTEAIAAVMGPTSPVDADVLLGYDDATLREMVGSDVSEDAFELIEGLLQFDHEGRLTASEALQSSYITALTYVEPPPLLSEVGFTGTLGLE